MGFLKNSLAAIFECLWPETKASVCASWWPDGGFIAFPVMECFVDEESECRVHKRRVSRQQEGYILLHQDWSLGSGFLYEAWNSVAELVEIISPILVQASLLFFLKSFLSVNQSQQTFLQVLSRFTYSTRQPLYLFSALKRPSNCGTKRQYRWYRCRSDMMGHHGMIFYVVEGTRPNCTESFVFELCTYRQ